MMEKGKSKKELLLENEELKLRLAEAEDTLRAIQQGEVDAILGASSGSDRIYTLQGAEHPYRVFFEAMNEGAVTMTLEGTILYCNHRFADLAKVPLEKVIGMSFLDFIVETSRQMVAALLAETGPENRSIESSLQLYGGRVMPVNISINPFKTAEMEAVCAIVTDLSELKVMRRLEEVNKELQASERQLNDSRRASLNIMEDAIAARKKTDEANAELLQEVTVRKQAEEALRESEERFRAVFESSSDCILVWDRHYNYLYANQAAIDHVGATRDMVIGKNIRDGLGHIPDFMRLWMGRVDRAFATGESFRVEDEVPVGDQLVYSESQVSPIRDAAGRVFAVSVVYRDITARKQAEDKLREQQRLHKSVTDNASLALFIMDNRQRCVFMNPAAVQLTGFTLAEVQGRPLHDVIHHTHPDGSPYPLSECAIDQAFPKNDREQGEEVFVHKDGHFCAVAFTASPLRDDSGRPYGTIIEVQDITERKRAEQELRESREDLERAQAVGQVGSWRLDVRSNMLTWSDENYRIFGIPKGTPLTYEMFLSKLHPDDREYVDTQWKAGLCGDPYDIEHRIMVDGHVKWVREKAYLEFDYDNELIGGFGITQDITERKQAEQDLLKLNEEMAARGLELERLNQELETFNYSVSHDLRAPLRSIEGFSRALGADHVDRLDAEGRDYLERVITAAHKMGRLITDLLNLSRISQEKIRRDRVDLSGMAVRIAEELKQEHPERNVTFIICEGLSACGDERLLNIALENLIVNALKFTKNRSEAAIEFGITDGADGPAYFVKDNGVGFDMTYADKLFAPFQRLHADTEFPGTGIGLATVKRIINRHGGTVWIEGVKGKGTTAYFTLP